MWHAGKNIPIKFHQDIPYSYLVTWLLDIYQRDVTPKSIYYKSLDQYLTTAMGYRDMGLYKTKIANLKKKKKKKKKHFSKTMTFT